MTNYEKEIKDLEEFFITENQLDNLLSIIWGAIKLNYFEDYKSLIKKFTLICLKKFPLIWSIGQKFRRKSLLTDSPILIPMTPRSGYSTAILVAP